MTDFYDWGPHTWELIDPCPVCGGLRARADVWDHERTAEHWDGVFRQMTEEDWATVISRVEHGLGWAESESMGYGDDDWVTEMLSRAIECGKASNAERARAGALLDKGSDKGSEPRDAA